jgi:hypothetical protein
MQAAAVVQGNHHKALAVRVAAAQVVVMLELQILAAAVVVAL